jgi:hypothetical protein
VAPTAVVHRKEISEVLLVLQFLCEIPGTLLLMTCIGMCANNKYFIPAMILYGVGSFCTVVNLALLMISRRQNLGRFTMHLGLAWMGAPMVLVTLLILRLSI